MNAWQITDYEVVTADTVVGLSVAVKEHMQYGWVPHGPMVIEQRADEGPARLLVYSNVYHQPVVKQERVYHYHAYQPPGAGAF